jgi:DnaJ-class molecular chaperone
MNLNSGNKSVSFYNALDVPETATPDEIKKAYRKLSMLYHPDKNGNSSESTEKFQKISEAYEVLGDAEKKKDYDMTQNNPFFKMMSQSMGPNQGMGSNQNMSPVDELFSSLFGMPFMSGLSPGPDIQFMGGGPNIRVFQNGRPVQMQGQSMQGSMFGQGPPSFFQQAPQKPAPIVKHINVPIDKILTGTTIPVDIERWLIENGTKMFERETVYVTVPKGIDEGEIILLKEKGNILNETNKGDIKIFIKIENNSEFKRSGLDLILNKTITVKEALCGFSFELKYITGKVYTITNNSGNIISHGYQKIIPNMGLTRDDHTGNLLIIFDVKFPEKLTEEVLTALKVIDF